MTVLLYVCVCACVVCVMCVVCVCAWYASFTLSMVNDFSKNFFLSCLGATKMAIVDTGLIASNMASDILITSHIE